MTDKKKVLMISGSYPNDVCGVGDYTKKLFDQLNDSNNDFVFELFYKKRWSLRLLFKHLNEIKIINPHIIHMQYPTEGYGYSFTPLLLMFLIYGKKKILTIHELSSRTLKARLYTLLLLFAANVIIVTNEVEKAEIKKNFIFKNKTVRIIRIASNIPISTNGTRSFENRETTLVYFGHIRPNKGIEEFINLCNAIKDDESFSFRIIGQSLGRYQQYLNSLIPFANGANIQLDLNSPNEETADMIANCKIAYLPFPDGVSARRGSLIASAINGCVIVSTYSTSVEINQLFDQYCYLVNNNEEAKSIIMKIASGKTNIKDATPIAKLFSWETVIDKHLDVYEHIS